MKSIKVAIIGLGARGGDVYGPLINERKEEFKIVSLCDKRVDRLRRFQEEFSVKSEDAFLEDVKFFEKKRADLIVIATQDKDHIGHIIKAMELGYDILVEKPVCDTEEDCEKLLSLQKKYGNKVFVCHVLRFAPAFVKIGELLAEGKIGDLVTINAIERVCYWHHCHSYVRGNWRNTSVAMPMILAKCCHDLDLIQYYAGAKCFSVSSVGENRFFNGDNAPESCADRCVQCMYLDKCVFSAKKIYLDKWKNIGKPVDVWPYNVIAEAPITEEKIVEALKNGEYGRCVFKCDNNVVDHQCVSMVFKNGVKANLTMMGLTAEGGRRYSFYGTKGEMTFDERDNTIIISQFGEKDEIIDVGAYVRDKGYGHGGGDYMLISALSDMLNGKINGKTSLENSIESHLIGICSEKSRLKFGERVFVHQK